MVHTFLYTSSHLQEWNQMHQNFYIMYKFPNLLMFLILFYKFIISWCVSLNLFISAKQYFWYVCVCVRAHMCMRVCVRTLCVCVCVCVCVSDVNKLTGNWNVKWQMAQFF